MTDLTVTPLHAPSPPALRLERPRWRDGRLVTGAVLVLLAVIGVVRIVAAADHTSPVVVAGVDLPAGHRIVAGDLDVVRARLAGPTTRNYFSIGAMTALVGDVVTRDVARGEYLPQRAVSTVASRPYREVVVVVRSARVPGVRSGNRVDLLVTEHPTGITGPAVTRALLDDVLVSDVHTAGGGTSDTTVRLQLPLDQVVPVIAAGQSGALDLALHPLLGDQGTLPGAPSGAAPAVAPAGPAAPPPTGQSAPTAGAGQPGTGAASPGPPSGPAGPAPTPVN